MDRPPCDDASDAIDGRALRYRHRRPELRDQVVRYVLDHGLADLSLRPLAAQLGVTHATLLHHFGTKEQLVVEVIDAIRSDLIAAITRQIGDPRDSSPTAMLRAVWHELRRPEQRPQFLLLFEVAAQGVRTPGRFGDLTESLVTAFVTPVEENLRRHGYSTREARDLAAGFVALVRGVHIDLAVSADQARADAVVARYINLIGERPERSAKRSR